MSGLLRTVSAALAVVALTGAAWCGMNAVKASHRSEKGCTEIVPSPQSMVAAIVAVDCDVVIRGWKGDRRR